MRLKIYKILTATRSGRHFKHAPTNPRAAMKAVTIPQTMRRAAPLAKSLPVINE